MINFKFLIFTLVAVFLALPAAASAHVRYLVSDKEFDTASGLDVPFLMHALSEPKNILAIIGTLIGLVVVYLIATKFSFFRKQIDALHARADKYAIFTPWMMRLSIGIALIGAGVSQTLLTPALPGYPDFAFIQILLGFLFIAGFLVVPATLVAICLYGVAFLQDWYTLGNLEFLALAISLLILDNEKPGLDDLLGLPKISPLRFLKQFVPILLRIGIGGSMMFLAVYEKLWNPHTSEIIVREFNLMNVVPVSPEMWILGAGVIEFAIGFMLILGWYTRVSSAIAFIVLSLSFFYFGEEVSSHIMLFGTLSVLYITRGGLWSIDCKRDNVNYEFTC